MILGPKTVMVVDDSETFVMYLSILLSRMGFDVIPAENGMEALRLLKILSPEVVILDVLMPDMDGITTLRYIKEDKRTSNIPVIMVSIDNDQTIYEKCVRLKCSGHLTKPVNVTELHDLLQECIVYSKGKKRRFLRTVFDKKVGVSFSGVTKEHYAVSLSEGGIYVRRKDPLPVGTEVEITLPLKGENTLTLKGSVIYRRELYGDVFRIAPGMAIEFKSPTATDSGILRAYITELLTEDIIEEQEEVVISIDDEEEKNRP